MNAGKGIYVVVGLAAIASFAGAMFLMQLKAGPNAPENPGPTLETFEPRKAVLGKVHAPDEKAMAALAKPRPPQVARTPSTGIIAKWQTKPVGKAAKPGYDGYIQNVTFNDDGSRLIVECDNCVDIFAVGRADVRARLAVPKHQKSYVSPDGTAVYIVHPNPQTVVTYNSEGWEMGRFTPAVAPDRAKTEYFKGGGFFYDSPDLVIGFNDWYRSAYFTIDARNGRGTPAFESAQKFAHGTLALWGLPDRARFLLDHRPDFGSDLKYGLHLVDRHGRGEKLTGVPSEVQDCDFLHNLQLSPSGQYISVHGKSGLEVWDWKAKRRTLNWSKTDYDALLSRILPDNKRILIMSKSDVVWRQVLGPGIYHNPVVVGLYDIESGKLLEEYKLEDEELRDARHFAVSRDGKRLGFAAYHRVWIVDFATAFPKFK